MRPTSTAACLGSGVAVLAVLGALAWSDPAAASPWRDADVQIELKPEVTARSGQVLFGELATIRTRDEQAILRLAALPVGAAPAAGGEALVGREALVRWMRLRLGILGSEVRWTGAERVRVLGGSAADRMQAPLQQAALARARSLIPQDAGVQVHEPAASLPQLAQASAHRSPAARIEPVISRGEAVLLVAVSGAVRLETRALALQDGAAGQVILVRPEHAAGVTQSARVVGPGRVEAVL